MPYIDKNIQTPVQQYGDWQVMPDGEIINFRRRLRIYPDRLTESDWWLNLRTREWMNSEWTHFIPAWFLACQTAGITEIPNFKLNY